MTTLTLFCAPNRVTSRDNRNRIEIKIPEYFLKLLLNSKKKALKNELNKRSIKEILTNTHIVNKNYIEPNKANFCLSNKKYKPTKNLNSETNDKLNSKLPEISTKKSLLNFRYKENPNNYEKFNNLGKELIKIQSKYNNIQTESIIPNKNVNQFYFIKKKTGEDGGLVRKERVEKIYSIGGMGNEWVGYDPAYNKTRSFNNLEVNKKADEKEIIINLPDNNNDNKDITSSNNNNETPRNLNIYSRNSKLNIYNKNMFSINKHNNIGNFHKSNSNNIKREKSNHKKSRQLLLNTYDSTDSYIIKENIPPTENDKINSHIESNLSNSVNKNSANSHHSSNENKQQKKKGNSTYKKKTRNILNYSQFDNPIMNNNKTNINNNINKINLKPLNMYFSNTNKKIREPPKLIPIKLINDFKKNYLTEEQITKKFNKIFQPYIIPPTFNSNETFYYYINKMYRSHLCEYMKHRVNWELVTKKNIENKTINFEWKYYSNRLCFKNFKYEPNTPSKKLRCVNLFERNYEVGNKKNMFINLINYCDRVNLNAFNLVPFTIIINNTKDVDYCLDALREIMEFSEKNFCNNKNMVTNRKYSDSFWFDKNFDDLKRQYININKNFLSKKNYWILKPTDLYQGKCIEISNNYDEISKKCRNMFKGVDKRFVPELIIKEEDEFSDDDNLNNNNTNASEFEENNEYNTSNAKNNKTKKIICSKMYCSNEIIIQKYLDNPLLYKKRKFDIRCFVLVDSNLNVFFCKEGHLKGSSEFYDLNLTNKFIHITNYSLQKKSLKFEQYEDGNEISYQDFRHFLKEEKIPLENFERMINQMKNLVEISFKAVGSKLLKTNPVLCFEIFGYDFIIDNDFKPWILEINNNPGLAISSPVIKKLVPRMLDDAFRLTIDKIFETKYAPECIDENGNYKSKYKLDGFSDEENVFEFLCNIK